jgi:hypothetical protein
MWQLIEGFIPSARSLCREPAFLRITDAPETLARRATGFRRFALIEAAVVSAYTPLVS